MWVDSHCHLDDERYGEIAQREIIERAKQNNVNLLITIGTSIESSKKAIKITESYDNVYCTVGIHPHDSDIIDLKSIRAPLFSLGRHPKVVAIGEIGLDYYKNLSKKETQISLFQTQLEVAKELNKPVVIHCRDAHNDCYQMLKDNNIEKGVLHCYTGNIDESEKYLAAGFYISFSGILTFKKADQLQEVAKIVPLDRVLIETDAPYLTPDPYRGKINEPAYVVKVAEKLMEIKKCDPYTLSQHLLYNTKKLFSIS
ncbi:MAG: TatD family hydrolase [Planctomycetes bacterium]|nr:TatD family hydrolase [Planctomycetota bacterium]